jgi:hypothetical protein
MKIFDFVRSLSPLLRPRKSWREFLHLKNLKGSQDAETIRLEREKSDLRNHITFLESVIKKFHEHEIPLLRLYGLGEETMSQASTRDQVSKVFEALQPSSCSANLIRLGSQNDGGYVIPDNLDRVEACFSPGVGMSSDFELEMAKRNIKSYLCDYSVDGPAREDALFNFQKKFVAARGSPDSKWISFSEWVRSAEPTSTNLVLQMDIDGGEWDILRNLEKETLTKFRTLVIEFHDFQFIQNHDSCDLILQVFEKLNEEFDVVNIHPNNFVETFDCFGFEVPKVFEATFYRKLENGPQKRLSAIDETLQSPNNPERPDLKLSDIWFPIRLQ